jgi:hypothetical protein
MTTVSEIMQAIADLSYAEQRIVFQSMQQLMTDGVAQQATTLRTVDFAVLRGKAMHLYAGTDAQVQVTALRREWDA